MSDPQDLHRALSAGHLGAAGPTRFAVAREVTDRAGRDLDAARSGLGAAWTGGTATVAQRALDTRSAELLAAAAELAVAEDLLAGVGRTQAQVCAAADRLLLTWLAAVTTTAITDPVGTAGVTAAVSSGLLDLQVHLDQELARAEASFDALAGGAARAVRVQGPVSRGAGAASAPRRPPGCRRP